MRKQNNKNSGQVFAIIIILIVLIGGGLWFLVSYKQQRVNEAKHYGRDAIHKIVVERDIRFLNANLAPISQLSHPMPPSEQQFFMQQLQQLGNAAEPIQIDENVTSDSFLDFEPHAFFTAHLNYPAGQATLQLAIQHATAINKWRIIDVTFTPPSQAR
jgi:hypothetical protein